MARLKFKPGDKVLFDFAGTRMSGTFIREKKVTYGTVVREYYVCEGGDGMIYPIDKTKVYKDE